MLDFLKETDKNLDKLQDSPDGKTGDEQYVTIAPHDKAIKKGTIILVVVFAVSLVCLWFMIKKSSPQAASANQAGDDTQMETAIAKVMGTKAEFFKGVDDVVLKFNEFSDVKQVKVNELQKNPFEHEEFSSTVITDSQDGIDASIEQERAMKAAMEDGARRMRLQSIIKSDAGYRCMIDGDIYAKGDTVRGWKVSAIYDSEVELSTGDMKVVLRISEK